MGKGVDGPAKIGDLFVAGATCFAKFALELADALAQGVGTSGPLVRSSTRCRNVSRASVAR
ncbi:hypothetical protein [Streptomyces alfalfae]